MEHLMRMEEQQYYQQPQQQHQQQQQYQQEPITALSLLEELMSSGLVLSGDFPGMDGVGDDVHHHHHNDHSGGLLDVDLRSTMIFHDEWNHPEWLLSRQDDGILFDIHDDDDNDNDPLRDPPLFRSTADFVLSPTEESVASDLSRDDDDDDDDDSLQVGSLMNQPRPGLQEEEDDSIQQQQQQLNDSRMSFGGASQLHRPGLQDDDACRPPEPASITTATESMQNTSSSSSSLSTSLYPVSPTNIMTMTTVTHLEWPVLTKAMTRTTSTRTTTTAKTSTTTTTKSPTLTMGVKPTKPTENCSWSMRHAFRTVEPATTKMASFYYSDF